MMESDHHHGHHHHDHASGNIAVAFILNSLFAIVELIGGILTNSVAIIADALHDFGDSLSLGTAWYFQKKSGQERSESFTYGYKRFSLIGAFVNAVVLITGSILIIRESVQRLFDPEPVNAKGMLFLALLGIAVNLIAMFRLRRGESINEKMVSLHFLEDVLGWVAVLAGSVVMMFADIPVIDPILSLLIAFFVLFNVFKNIKPAFNIILQRVPENISEKRIRDLVLADQQIVDIHDFRMWTLDGFHHVLSMHVVVSDNLDLQTAEELKQKIKLQLRTLHITHATIEVEFNPRHCKEL